MTRRRSRLARATRALMPRDERRRELTLGLLGLAVATVLIAAAAITYTVPLGERTYRADLVEAGAMKVGDSVRVAGVPVGHVRALELLADRVRMSFTVDSGIVLGEATTLDVRMLTAVGGHYLAVLPAGRDRLGGKIIPADRVRLPYSLARVFEDAARPVGEIDGDTLRRNFAVLGSSLTADPDSLRRMGQAASSLVDIMITQRADISRVLAVADEYLAATQDDAPRLFHLIGSLRRMEDAVFAYRQEIVAGLSITERLLARLTALRPVWDESLAPLVDELTALLPQLRGLGDTFGTALADVTDTLTRLRQLVTPQGTVAVDHSARVATVDAVCVPLPGAGC
ncbi:MlaD family protein [Nocardia sp. NPDC047648]|uniref:MlaD family protein n=1 Tax=Nocardia sp. NPDC047648 TaxID=3155625 RepID=UPI0034018404